MLRLSLRLSLRNAAILAALTLTSPVLAESKAYTMLKVDGDEISSTQVAEAWKSLFPDGVAPAFEGFDEEVRQNVLRGLVSENLLYKEAAKAGVPERESIKLRLKNLEKQIAIQAYIEELSGSFVNEKSVKQAYDRYVEKTKKEEEVRARHILVDSEDLATEVAEKLDAGKDFASLAKKTSKDKGSAARGGDLGYFTKDKMVPEFAKTAFALKPGELSKPVKSDFGWHVIKVEDRRPVEVLPLSEVQEQLKADIRKKGVEHYVDELINKADVTYYSESGGRKKLKLK